MADRKRSRSRSPSGRRRGKSPPNVSSSKHTNSDDPDLLKSRVFIGNLPSDKLDQSELSVIYEKYGKVLAVSILRGFGFIQFLNETDAREAVRNEHGSMLKGNKLDIKMAAEGRKKPGDRNPPPRGGPERRSPPRDRDRINRDRERERDRDRRDRDRERDRDRDRDRERPPRREDPYGSDPFARRGRDPPGPGRDPYDRKYPGDGYDDPFRRGAAPARDAPPPPRDPYDRYPADPFRRDAPPDPYARGDPYARADPYPAPPPPAPEPKLDVPPFECQIFMLSTGIRPYAEALERRLAAFKMACDIRLLPEELPQTKAIEEVSKRRIPYAITITAQNEVHRSITLNILHGTPQEHRNMPLEDALGLISRKFEEHVKEVREKAALSGGGALKAPAGAVGPQQFMPPNSHTHYLLNLLADNRFLTLDELDNVISYLVERRRRLADRNIGPASDEKAINDQQAELQNKILDILNGDPSPMKKVAAPQALAGYPQSVAAAPATGTSINFDNPSVQRALDNLIQTGPSLLKNISAVSVPTQPPVSTRPSHPGGYGAPPSAHGW